MKRDSLGRFIKGVHYSKKTEFKKGLILWIKGKKLPELSGKNHHMFGKHHSKKTIEKMRLKKLGKRLSKKTKNKLSRALSGEKCYWFGKHLSEETKQKIRLSKLNITIPNKDTLPEKKVQKMLKKHKIKFEKNKNILGRPDIFIEPKICIFVDGDFWHANPKKYNPNHIIIRKKKAKEIWAYDKSVTARLRYKGYTVLRFWESTILNNPDKVLNRINSFIG